jgi:hypothetical protein
MKECPKRFPPVPSWNVESNKEKKALITPEGMKSLLLNFHTSEY